MPLDYRIYVTDTTNNQIITVDLQDVLRQETFPVSETVWCLAVSPDQKTVYAGSQSSCSVFIVDVFGGASPIKIPTGGSLAKIVYSLVLDAARNCLYAGTDRGLCKMDLTTRQSTVWGNAGQAITSLRMSPDGNTLYGQYCTESFDKGVFSCDLTKLGSMTQSSPITSNQLTNISGASAYGLEYNESANQIWACYNGSYAPNEDRRTNQILVFNATTLAYQKSIPVSVEPSSIVLDGVGSRLFVLIQDGTIQIIDTHTLTCSPNAIQLMDCPGLTTTDYSFTKMFRLHSTLYLPDSSNGRVMEVDLQTLLPTKVYQVPNTDSPRGFSNTSLYQGIGGYYPAPYIASLPPTGGTVGAPLVITGNGFSHINLNNVVFFSGNVQATPTQSTKKQLTLTIPEGAQSGPLWVQSAGQISNLESLSIASSGGSGGGGGTGPALVLTTAEVIYDGSYRVMQFTGTIQTSAGLSGLKMQYSMNSDMSNVVKEENIYPNGSVLTGQLSISSPGSAVTYYARIIANNDIKSEILAVNDVPDVTLSLTAGPQSMDYSVTISAIIPPISEVILFYINQTTLSQNSTSISSPYSGTLSNLTSGQEYKFWISIKGNSFTPISSSYEYLAPR